LRVFFKKPTVLFIIIGLLFSSISFFLLPLSPFSSIAHRGASAYAPENTMAAFQKAIELGFDYIEFDVRLSKDGELVVIHDADVTRTTNGIGLVNDLTTEELKRLDAGSWFNPSFKGETIPLLSEVLNELGGKIGLLIELKSAEENRAMSEKLADLLKISFNNGLNPETVKVQSFQPKEMEYFSTLCPNVPVGIVANKTLTILHLASYRNYASFISIHHQFLSKSFIKQAQLLNLEIYSWTIKEQRQFLAMQSLSVNGIISNVEMTETHSNRFLATLFLKGHQFFRAFV
jgi:glycerophosphoryl diester phosphodiesterase